MTIADSKNIGDPHIFFLAFFHYDRKKRGRRRKQKQKIKWDHYLINYFKVHYTIFYVS